jgi:hypothetical protein
MPDRNVAKVSVKHTEDGPAVAVVVPGGTRLERVIADESLIDAIRGLRGCEACHSGHPLYITEEYGDSVMVDLSQ